MPDFVFRFLRMCFPCRHTYLISFFAFYACVSLTIIHTQIFFSSFMHVFHNIITLNNKNPGKELSQISGCRQSAFLRGSFVYSLRDHILWSLLSSIFLQDQKVYLSGQPVRFPHSISRPILSKIYWFLCSRSISCSISSSVSSRSGS